MSIRLAARRPRAPTGSAVNTRSMSDQTFDQAQHPRETTGRFTTKTVDESPGGMSALTAAHHAEHARAMAFLAQPDGHAGETPRRPAHAQPALRGLSERALGVGALRPVDNPLSAHNPRHVAAVADRVVDMLATTEGWEECAPVEDTGTDYVQTDRAVRLVSQPETVVQAAPAASGSSVTTVAILDASLTDPWRSAGLIVAEPVPGHGVDVVEAFYGSDGTLRRDERARAHAQFDPAQGPKSRRVDRCAEHVADMVDRELSA